MTPRDKIRAFCEDPENFQKFAALLKVGHDKGDPVEKIFKIVVADILFRFHGIHPNQQQN